MGKHKKKLKKAGDQLLDADAELATRLAPYRESAPVKAIAWLSEIGDQPQMRILCGTVVAAGLLRGDRRLTEAGVRMLAAHSVATWAKDFIKLRVDRTRPRSHDGKSEGHKPTLGHDDSKEETSFPSGHSAGAAAVGAAFARLYPEHRVAAAAGAAAIALAQIPRCAHYVSDVGVGLALGLIAEAAVNGIARVLPSEDEAAAAADQ